MAFTIEEIQEIEKAFTQLPVDAGAILRNDRVIDLFRRAWTEARADYFQWRDKFKSARVFPISELDDLVIPRSSDASVVDILIDLGRSGATFLHDADGEGYAEIIHNKKSEVWPIRSSGFAHWLRTQYYKKHGKGVMDQPLKAAAESLLAIALHEGVPAKISIRFANFGSKYFFDTGNEDTTTIEIDANGWRNSTQCPVKFLRNQNFRSLPESTGKGDIELLWRHVNVSKKDRLLLLAWILECFRPETPYVLCGLMGEQGTAKSTTQQRLRELIDPNKVMLRAAPKKAEDIAIAARNNALVSYENLSYLTADHQDIFCVILTGGGIASRQFYTNYEEASIEIKRPVILNGISSFLTRPDLLDRSILCELPTISESDRRPQSECDAEWIQDRQMIFVGILDLFSATLKLLPEVKLDKSPRMADFARLGEAMSRSLGYLPGEFSEAYLSSRREAVEIVLDGDPVATALENYLDTHPNGFCILTKTLLEDLRKRLSSDTCRDFPKTARALGNAIRRNAPVFRLRGWEISQERKEKGVFVSIRKLAEVMALHESTASTYMQANPVHLNDLHVHESNPPLVDIGPL